MLAIHRQLFLVMPEERAAMTPMQFVKGVGAATARVSKGLAMAPVAAFLGEDFHAVVPTSALPIATLISPSAP